MTVTTIPTAGIADDAVGNTKLDLSENYAFTGTVTGAGKVLKITTSAYESVTSTSGSTFVDVTTITHTNAAQNSRFLIEVKGGSTTCNSDKYMGMRCQVSENSGSFSTLSVSGGNTWGSFFGANATYLDVPLLWANFYTPSNTSTLTSVAFKFQIASLNTSGNVSWGVSNLAGSGVDGATLLQVTEVIA
tara:strand:- start:23 stop:589 length:567 start_codon:yes stop_codon:yes gene_type:complete